MAEPRRESVDDASEDEDEPMSEDCKKQRELMYAILQDLNGYLEMNRKVNELVEVGIADRQSMINLADAIVDLAIEALCRTDSPSSLDVFADLIAGLNQALPPICETIDGEKKQMRFWGVLIGQLQDQFELAKKSVESYGQMDIDSEDDDSCPCSCAEAALAGTVILLGKLHVRSLSARQVVAQVLGELLNFQDVPPESAKIHSAIDLLHVCASCFKASPRGQEILALVMEQINRFSETGQYGKVYSPKVHCEVACIHERQRAGWPPEAAAQVLLKFQPIEAEEAAKCLTQLKQKKQLPPSQMQMSVQEIVEEAGDHQLLRISSVLSDNTLAVVSVEDISDAATLKNTISTGTGLFKDCLVVCEPDGTPLCEAAKESQ